ncbi:hypothetical protein AX16_001974 [Volvariella volvacea WC 439]|nr:hypothetical protein AX16_001974 [Volvariella volvacea WC 439]
MATNLFRLRNGISIPAVGLGTWAGPESDKIERAKGWILTALELGYRHLDTAAKYETERSVGEALQEAQIPRGDVFITTKLPWNHHERVEESFNESLKALGTDYVDLYLMHWPQVVVYEEGNWMPRNADGSLKTQSSPTFHDTWRRMEQIYKSGRARAIGVSNFSIKTLDELLQRAEVVPMVNQVELHPYLAQNELMTYLWGKGIQPAAYSPTGWARVRDDPLITSIATKRGISPVQVILAWHLSRGTVVVPKSENPSRQEENLQIPKLTNGELDAISKLDRGERIANKADNRGHVHGWTYEQLGW